MSDLLVMTFVHPKWWPVIHFLQSVY